MKYRVIFAGEILDVADLGMVQKNVSRVFGLSAEKTVRLFSGQRFVLKTGIELEAAVKLMEKMKRAGAVCHIEEETDISESVTAAAQPEQSASPVPRPVSSSPAPGAPVTPVSSGSSESASNAPPIQDAGADTGSPVGLAPHGVPLIETTHVPEVIIDTSGYSLAAPGVQLVEPQEVVPPVIDTSALSLSESGAVLAAPKPADNADIDTRAYSLEP